MHYVSDSGEAKPKAGIHTAAREPKEINLVSRPRPTFSIKFACGRFQFLPVILNNESIAKDFAQPSNVVKRVQ
jgi:hypothetical protein